MSYQGASPSGGCSLFGVHSEANQGSGILIDTVLTRTLISGGWIEGNILHGIHIKDSTNGCSVDGMRISGVGTSVPENHGIHIANSPKSCYVHGNFIARESGANTYGQIYQDTTNVSNVVTPNWDGVGGLLS